MASTPHTFHIPVMGLAFTIDTPVKVARFGISSVISIVEDRLIEMMRKVHYPATGASYYPIAAREPDSRAKRITDYLNLINSIVQAQIEKMRNEPFEIGSDIEKYFNLLPETNMLKNIYRRFVNTQDEKEKKHLEKTLREKVVAGSIDVNVMTKTDRDIYDKEGLPVEDGSDAVAALRGYANSNLCNSSIVFSAGMNPRLYNYLEKCNGFGPDEEGNFIKKVIIKVSDYRSALIQGKYLAKKGIWVSEFRIESGLNCGGHAFATEGYLLGPILEEFKIKKQELINEMFGLYNDVLKSKSRKTFKYAPQLSISVQGGIGTAEEDQFLRTWYPVSSTGWGSPFLLVPEATSVDDPTLGLLAEAKEENIVLSRNSPLGVRFYSLENTSASVEKKNRITNGRPGSPCTEKHLAFNTEFTSKPICTASHKYQKLKIAALKSLPLTSVEYEEQLNGVLSKECLCIGLSNSASIRNGVPFVNRLTAVSICPGPNIAYFNKVVSLQTMVDHIYGRINILADGNRPDVFIKELSLYIKYFEEQLKENQLNPVKQKKQSINFYNNLISGIEYYRKLSLVRFKDPNAFNQQLDNSVSELVRLNQLYNILPYRFISNDNTSVKSAMLAG